MEKNNAKTRCFPLRNQLYRLLIDDVTSYCYENCLNYFPAGSAILDVGIGSGEMIRKHHHLIKSRNFRITGIDIDECYLAHCERLIRDFGLENYIELFRGSVEDYTPPGGKLFDFILFSMSFMLMKDQSAVLDRIKPWLKESGEIVFFQTMFKKRLQAIDLVKPRLKYVTTVDFGKAIYEKDFFGLLREKDLFIAEDRLIKKKEWFGGEYRMIAATIGGRKRRNVRKAPGTV